MPANTYVKNAGSWQRAKGIYIKNTGTWRPVKNVFVRSAGTWQRVFGSNPGSQEFTTVGSGTWTVPDGVYSVTATIIGGGGGGGTGNEDGNNNSGGGGGSGGAQTVTISVTPGAVISYTVGKAGEGLRGVYIGTANSGGNSSFAGIISTGGGGGQGVNDPNFALGGLGGSPNGIKGENGFYSASGTRGGYGANNYFGLGNTAPFGTGGFGGRPTNGTAGDGGNATGVGAGGGGGGATDQSGTPGPSNGGNGSPGYIKITW